jgi:hypothetical protein
MDEIRESKFCFRLDHSPTPAKPHPSAISARIPLPCAVPQKITSWRHSAFRAVTQTFLPQFFVAGATENAEGM